MKNLTLLLWFLPLVTYSQSITVDDTSNSPNQLVDLLLGNSCTDVSNISISSPQSIAYFNNNGSSFPISEGIIIRSGIARHSAGSYTGNNLDSQENNSGDSGLQAIINNLGQSGNITDVAYLEFDFIPLSSNFSFDFLFASNEYGQWQCASFDTFAFFLTDLNTNTTTNLAVIPNTNTPISALNIRDQAYNGNCLSSNSGLFGTYNVNNPNSTLNMRGHTVVMNASSSVIPNTPYKIRLVIGDYQDSRFDSAVFLASGSFVTTIDLGIDSTICNGDNRTITSNLDDTEFTHSWTLNGNLLSETSNTLTVTQSGLYEVTATKTGTNCIITDEIRFLDLQVNTPENLVACNNGSLNYNYDLTINNEINLGIDDVVYDIAYYNSLTDATNNTNAIPQAQLSNYNSAGNETIYLSLLNTNTNNFCDAIYTFDLLVDNPITINAIDNIETCTSSSGFSTNLVANSLQNNPHLSQNYNLSFYPSQIEAQTGGNGSFPNPTNYTIGSGINTQTIWVRVESSINTECFGLSSFEIIIHPLPPVDTIASVIECHTYTLPNIINGNYFSEPNGTGIMYNNGDSIDISGTYYIFNGPDANGCTNESSFQVTLIDQYTIPLEHCGEFIIPNSPAGSFYRQAGGPTNSSNELIETGTSITNSQTIYFYADVNETFCKEEAFPLIIHPLPQVDQLNDVVTCMSYTLEPLTNGNYFSAQGTPLNAGDFITTTQTITIANGPDNNGCSNQSNFTIYIINNIGNQSSCGSYTLPNLDAGNYYTGPNGTGTEIPSQTEITTSQTVYIYASTSTVPNCTDNMSFEVTILPIPPVDELVDIIECDYYILPTLTNGNYFTEPNGQGNMLNPGDIIDLTGNNYSPGTYYIYTPANNVGCDNQSTFTVTINPLPPVDTVGDLYFCAPYSLPDPINGNYYTEPNGNGILITPNMIFEETKNFYIYAIEPTTGCFTNIPFTVYYNFIGLPDYNNEASCDNFILQPLTHSPESPDNYSINYYSQPGGNPTDIIQPSNYTLTSSQTIYVYASNGDRFPCTEEKSFTVTISPTPNLNTHPIDFSAINGTNHCNSFSLPALDSTPYTINYYSQPGGNPTDIIQPSNYTFSVNPGSTSETFTVWVYASATDNVNCFDEQQFEFTIHPLSTFEVENGIICVHPETGIVENTTTLEVIENSILNSTNYNIEWYLNGVLMGNGFQHIANQIGTYDVIPIRLSPENAPDCSFAPTTATVTQSSTAIAEVILTNAFEDVAIATVIINQGFGSYEYQLDNNNFQTNHQFYDISSGDHIITVNDILGNCGDTKIHFTVIKYPKFFTPNGDGYNDRWNIFDLEEDSTAIISIFDRYGKLIKQISPTSKGWDGTYNGTPLPSTDYWFIVNYTHNGEKREFKSHFTMKR